MRVWYYAIHPCGKLFRIRLDRSNGSPHLHRKRYQDPVTGVRTCFCPRCELELFQHTPMKYLHEVTPSRNRRRRATAADL